MQIVGIFKSLDWFEFIFQSSKHCVLCSETGKIARTALNANFFASEQQMVKKLNIILSLLCVNNEIVCCHSIGKWFENENEHENEIFMSKKQQWKNNHKIVVLQRIRFGSETVDDVSFETWTEPNYDESTNQI